MEEGCKLCGYAESCPSCGSKSIEIKEKEDREINIDIYQKIKFKSEYLICYDCDFSKYLNEHKVKALVAQSNKETMIKIINNIEIGDRRSFSYIERALRLNPGSIKKWKIDGGSPSDLALMKLIDSMGWLVEVADNKYEPQFINETVLKEY